MIKAIKAIAIVCVTVFCLLGTVNVPALAQNPQIAIITAQNPDSNVNVRAMGTVHSRKKGYSQQGDKVRVLECVNDGDTVGSDLNWCKVKFLKSFTAQKDGKGLVGWVRSDFLDFAGDGY
ncbi:MAG: SH3 domain-containing protein [Cyanobacteriota bacterium]|nr:SH3 domain-containing protein [Cyanobacteriota bacterium]